MNCIVNIVLTDVVTNVKINGIFFIISIILPHSVYACPDNQDVTWFWKLLFHAYKSKFSKDRNVVFAGNYFEVWVTIRGCGKKFFIMCAKYV